MADSWKPDFVWSWLCSHYSAWNHLTSLRSLARVCQLEKTITPVQVSTSSYASTTMTPEQLEAIKKNEFATYKREVSSAIEPKLYILLVHLYIEHLLERFLAANLKKTDGLFGKNGLTFDKKVLLVEAMGGLHAQLVDGIKKLNAIRNNCAHTFKYNPTKDELDEFGHTLGKTYTDMKRKNENDHDRRMRTTCAHLCGKLLRAVVNAEHKDA